MAWVLVVALLIVLVVIVAIANTHLEHFRSDLDITIKQRDGERNLCNDWAEKYKSLQAELHMANSQVTTLVDEKSSLVNEHYAKCDMLKEDIVSLRNQLDTANESSRKWRKLYDSAEQDWANAKQSLIANVNLPARKRVPWAKAIEDAFNG